MKLNAGFAELGKCTIVTKAVRVTECVIAIMEWTVHIAFIADEIVITLVYQWAKSGLLPTYLRAGTLLQLHAFSLWHRFAN